MYNQDIPRFGPFNIERIGLRMREDEAPKCYDTEQALNNGQPLRLPLPNLTDSNLTLPFSTKKSFFPAIDAGELGGGVLLTFSLENW